jgi:uncharacterized protein (DUF1330 family)
MPTGVYPRTREHLENMSKASKGKTLGEKNGRWVGGETLRNGYVMVYCPDHPKAHGSYVRKHRLVIEQQIGRYLDRSEVIHHLRSKTDNEPKDLMAFASQSAHLRFQKNESNVALSEIVFDGRKL